MQGSYEQRICELCEAHYDAVYRFLYHVIGNRNDAEDVTQEVFIRVLESLPRYDGRVQLRTWIFSIAKHVAIDLYRRKRFFRMVSDLWFHRLPSQEGSPQEQYEKKEQEWELGCAIRELPAKYRAVIALRSMEGCSVRETADILGISESKVKVDYHRAVRLLQKKLAALEQKGARHACTGKTNMTCIKE